VASMVVGKRGRMKKSDYRKFIIRGDEGQGEEGDNGNSATADTTERRLCEHARSVTRRYRRLQEEKKEFPRPDPDRWRHRDSFTPRRRRSISAGQIINQPVASIAKKEEILYVLGQEDEPIVLGATSAGVAPDSADSR